MLSRLTHHRPQSQAGLSTWYDVPLLTVSTLESSGQQRNNEKAALQRWQILECTVLQVGPAHNLLTHISPSARLCQSLLPTYALNCHLSLCLEVEHFHLKKKKREIGGSNIPKTQPPPGTQRETQKCHIQIVPVNCCLHPAAVPHSSYSKASVFYEMAQLGQ